MLYSIHQTIPHTVPDPKSTISYTSQPPLHSYPYFQTSSHSCISVTKLKVQYVTLVLLELLVVFRALFDSAARTTTSPFTELADILRFFALGGVLGGASATVAFFFPRGMAGKQKLDLEVAVPILEDAAWLRSEANQKLVVVYLIVQRPFGGLMGVPHYATACAAPVNHLIPQNFMVPL
jgi:hypothetical protein